MCYNQHNTINSLKEIKNLTPVLELLELCDQDTLVIFDIDDVLIMPTGEDDFRHPYRNNLLHALLNPSCSHLNNVLESIIFSATNRILVDNLILDLISYIKRHKIAAIALTATGSGRFGIIPKMENFRIKELNKVNISFADLSGLNYNYFAYGLTNHTKVFPKASGVPCLKSGVIFAAGIDKSLVLEHVLGKYNYFPKKIIFIDDYLYNLTAVQRLCLKLKIPFHGYHYTAVSLLPLPIINEPLERMRFAVLKYEHKWLKYAQLSTSRVADYAHY